MELIPSPSPSTSHNMLDTRLTLSSILQIAVVVASVSIAYGNLSTRISNLEKQSEQRAADLALINAKLDAIDIKMSDLGISIGRTSQKVDDLRSYDRSSSTTRRQP